jgi:hypothetical protein
MKSGAPGRYYHILAASKDIGPGTWLALTYLAQWLGDLDALLSLEVLQDGADCPRGGSKGRVESMDIGLLHVCLLLHTVPDLKISALVVCAVATADQLLELSLVGEPSFKIKLLCGRVVCLAIS